MKNIKEILKEKGVRQDWLATKLGISNSMVSQVVNGNKRSHKVYESILDLLIKERR